MVNDMTFQIHHLITLDMRNELETLLQGYLKDVKRRYQSQPRAIENLTFTRVYQLEFDGPLFNIAQ